MSQQPPTQIIFDRLYQQIPYTENDLRLYQTKELARLHHVSLSAVPVWTLPTSTCATKFEHSVGVAYLAQLLGKNPKFKDVAHDLYFAALGHDLGTPPFSHVSEIFQMDLLGLNHEQFIDVVLEGSEFAAEVKRQGGNIARIAAFIKGEEKPLSDIINGTIDLDNLDNSLRFGISMGLISQLRYAPEKLAQAFDTDGQTIVLSQANKKELYEWDQCRKVVYDFVYSNDNIRAETMISRAMQIAMQEGEIMKDYFFMTDAQAQQYLEERCNQRTQQLMRDTKLWKFYPQVFRYSTTSPSDTLKTLVNGSWNKPILADELSAYLKVDPVDICVSAGMNKGFKKIHLSITDESGEIVTHDPQNELSWLIQIYVHPRIQERKTEIEEFIKDKLID